MELSERFPLDVAERPLRFLASADPIQLVREELARLAEQQQSGVDRLLVQLALTHFQVQRVRGELEPHCGSTAEALTIIMENLEDLLAAHRVRYEDYTGQMWTAAMRGDVQLRGHQIREGLTEPRVAHMVLPVVYRGERRLAQGEAILDTPRHDETLLL